MCSRYDRVSCDGNSCHFNTSAAQDIAKKLSECGVGAELIGRSGIVRLCNLVNNPAYVHIESTNIDEAIALLAV